mmetsp:Transcript_30610/g.45296  ORF Transcript_30610/g.45296 Transcript_30610/m.45296 type:complete len:505 (+) Transcript_30610:98-1612(+)|eukprot:CAMPEP_0194206400 /NCGR_PEP_ID=MMETSP0156-20130528/5449_1 /TAXON_ID=33649 /ORGANISM="Thalassionema nitzschioides, Strain L26-B" /LENGTH=504 /DNA_ID=CAMNT_0038932923 /DNA_START=40 /DNA_END=1554 /DNA_ORIENTATION=-
MVSYPTRLCFIIAVCALLVIVQLVLFQHNDSLGHHRRRLLPDRLYQKYYTRVKANTEIVPRDETLGRDEHLSTCWNDKVFANLHEKDPIRRKKYERYFLGHAPLTDGISGYQESPGFFTITGDKVNLMYSDWTGKNFGGLNHYGFTALSLWNSTFTLTKNSQPSSCMVCKPPNTSKLHGGPKYVLTDGGEYVSFVGWMWGHYGHSTHDNLPWFAYVHEMGVRNDQVKFILLDTMHAKEILTTLDPDLAANRVVWVQKDEFVQVQNGGSITTIQHMKHRNDDPRFMDFLRSWSARARDRSSRRNKVIYYDRRNPFDTMNQRYMRPDIEEQLFQKIKEGLKKFHRTEELVTFNGLVKDDDNDGELRRMTVEEQFELFKDATTIIGPHGSGLSGNLLWTNPSPKSCADRVKVLEFIGDTKTSKNTSPMGNGEYISHWEYLRGWPFDYHHILYEPESTQTGLVVNLDRVEEALEAMWAPAPKEEDVPSIKWDLKSQHMVVVLESKRQK